MTEKPGRETTSTPEAPTPEELRERIRGLVDRLPDSELWRIDLFLRGLLDPERTAFLWKHATAPYEDEPLTEEAEAVLRESRKDDRLGKVRPFEDVIRELGL